MNIKDTGEHLAAHALLESGIRQLHRSISGSMDTVAKNLDGVNNTMQRVCANVQTLQKDFAVSQEKFEHMATSEDLSTAISTCRAARQKPTNWKAITGLVTGVIAAISALVIAILGAVI